MDDWRSIQAFWPDLDPFGGDLDPLHIGAGSRASRPPQEPAYMRKLRYLAKVGMIPTDIGLHMIDVLHDNWCAQMQGQGVCDCNPTIRLKASAPTNRQN